MTNLKIAIFAFFGRPNYLRRLQWATIHRMLNTRNDHVVLDLGAGPMQYSKAIANEDDAFVIAADLDFRERDLKFINDLPVHPIRADGCNLPFADQSVDRILASSVLHMVPDPSAVLNECRRVLKDSGHVVMSVPNNYQFIPKLMRSSAWPLVRWLFGLPNTLAALVVLLNDKFGVGGPQGYYSREELILLLRSSGLAIVEHEYSPGYLGSMLWEYAVLASVRLGNVAFHFLILFYPIVYLLDALKKSSVGSEHVFVVSPD